MLEFNIWSRTEIRVEQMKRNKKKEKEKTDTVPTARTNIVSTN